MARFSVEEVSPIERRISVEVAPEAVVAQLEEAYQQLSRRVRVPGFRPGKVPRRILEARFKDQVEADVVQHLVENSFREALIEHPEVLPVAPPRVTDNEGLNPGQPFRYQARIEVKPKLDPKEYEGLELKAGDYAVTDAQVDEQIEKLRDAMAQFVPVEGRVAAQEGDYATIDFEGTIDGKPFKGGKSQDQTAHVASGEFIQGKIAALAGVSVGESKEIDYTFAKDHRLAELAEKTARFKVTLKALKERKVPALDDALAKETGAGETVAELRERILKDLTEQANAKADRERREQLVGGLIQRNPFEVPQAMVERAIDQMLENVMQNFTRQGMDPRRMQINFDRMRDSFRDSAVTEVKGALLLEAIAEKEKLAASAEDVEAKVQELAEQLRMPAEQVRPYLTSGEEGQSLRHRLREEKTLAFLASKAKISQS